MKPECKNCKGGLSVCQCRCHKEGTQAIGCDEDFSKSQQPTPERYCRKCNLDIFKPGTIYKAGSRFCECVKQPIPSLWEMEFEEEFAGSTGYCNPTYSKLIKSFITQLLADQKEQEREKIKKIIRKKKIGKTLLLDTQIEALLKAIEQQELTPVPQLIKNDTTKL